PTLYVWSTEDIALGRTAAELTARHVDGPYRFEVLEGVSHWIPEAAADELAALLVDHLLSPPPHPPRLSLLRSQDHSDESRSRSTCHEAVTPRR
ncbi:MAG: alpha/beta hydrolase, partial [Acidimicrobiia bacterium]|nr:alpha/beta hydrolase [Acidimicrobiia bacterium]